MKTASLTPTTKNQPNLVAGILARFAQIVLVFGVQAAILFFGAGKTDWVWAWTFLGICILSLSINSFFLLRTNPGTIAERGSAKLTKGWDKLIAGLWSLFIFLLVPLVAALDERFAWTRNWGAIWNVTGAVMLAAGLGLGGWAMITNAFFSTAVRIQTDRGQFVCRTGPYGIVRHPGYVGFAVQSLATPILLGSLWAIIPGIIAAALLILRTAFEDDTLVTELPGYADYAAQVRFRLIPGIW